MKTLFTGLFGPIILLLIIFYSLPSKANDLDCLVEAIYYEARSEGVIPKIAVANVILQRVKDKRYPSTICEVVHQGKKRNGRMVRNRCQFSYYCDGKEERIKDYTSLIEVMDVASLVLEGILLERTQGATHYHAYYVKPRWAIKTKRFKNLGRVGAHIFYIDKGNQ